MSVSYHRNVGGGGGGTRPLQQPETKIDHRSSPLSPQPRLEFRARLPKDVDERLEELGFNEAERELWAFEPEHIIHVLWYAEVEIHAGQCRSPRGLILHWLQRMKMEDHPGPLPWRQHEEAYIRHLRDLALGGVYTFPEYLRREGTK
jgi:hypothetical protein